MEDAQDIDAVIAARRGRGEPFAVATVVRALASTAARAGAKAVLDESGDIVAGFLGGGCVRGAVGRAARAAIEAGEPQLVSLKPEDLLAAEGVSAGEARDGVLYARNGCPSRGSMDVFVEPVLPRPLLLIAGTGPVATALADLAGRFDFALAMAAQEGTETISGSRIVAHLDPDPIWEEARFVVIATQGRGDAHALRRAVEADAPFVAFVGSRRKFATLSRRLASDGLDGDRLARIHAPAGLDIHAITPEEIALSILSQIVAWRRSGGRGKRADRPEPEAA